MGDEHTPMPGVGICGYMRYVGAEGGTKMEICTFPKHNERVHHFFQDFQQYYDTVMNRYTEWALNPEKYTPEMQQARDDFIFNTGEAVQELRSRTRWEREQAGLPVDNPPLPPSLPGPVDPPRDGRYPPLRLVQDGDAPRELGICGETKQEDGETYICVNLPSCNGRPHGWLLYVEAVDDAKRRWERLGWWARQWWKDKLKTITGERPKDLPPPLPPKRFPVRPDRWQNPEEPPPMPPDPEPEPEPMPDYPPMPTTPEEERRKPLDPEHGGGHFEGARGPGDPRWDNARKAGANWQEPDDGATRAQDPSGEPLPPSATGEFLGAKFHRKRITTNPNECGLLDKAHGKIYICRAPFGHVSDGMPHRWRYLHDATEQDDY